MSESPIRYLYLIERSYGWDWDEYGAAVVCAENDYQAKNMNPRTSAHIDRKEPPYDWCQRAELVTVTQIGVASPHMPCGVVVASFNSG